MAAINLNVNGKKQTVNVEPATPVLWVLRDHLDLVGTKYGCGVAQCGTCTIHLDGVAARSCMLPCLAFTRHSLFPAPCSISAFMIRLIEKISNKEQGIMNIEFALPAIHSAFSLFPAPSLIFPNKY